MSIIEFIILAIALSFEAMIVMHGCALKTPIRLTQGLAESITIAAVNALLLLLGIWMGNLLRFTPAELDPNASSTNSLLTDTEAATAPPCCSAWPWASTPSLWALPWDSAYHWPRTSGARPYRW